MVKIIPRIPVAPPPNLEIKTRKRRLPHTFPTASMNISPFLSLCLVSAAALWRGDTLTVGVPKSVDVGVDSVNSTISDSKESNFVKHFITGAVAAQSLPQPVTTMPQRVTPAALVARLADAAPVASAASFVAVEPVASDASPTTSVAPVDESPTLIDETFFAPEDAKELVIIRTYIPSPAMKERFHKIINDNTNRDVIISINSHTHLSNTTKLERERKAHMELIEEFGEDRIYIYTDEMVDKLFPTLAAVPKFVAGQYGIASYGYYLSNECARIAIEQFLRRTRKHILGGVWVMVDDMEYTGNWKELFDKYTMTEAIKAGNTGARELVKQLKGGYMVSHGYGTRNNFSTDPWAKYSSTYFKEHMVEEDKIAKHTEHVVFYSNRFIRLLMDEMKKGAHAQSEMGTATMCNVLSCKHIQFQDEDIDADGFWVNNKRKHTPEEVKTHLADLQAKGQHRLVHPCKW
ncbi:hypothetical protein AAMO2058_000813500 [Amorphochlora amoebiformis]|uniref:Uncharacterized protein n=1 Tax=Amorphochlora amoebiformis TaxID=1561963 RepID=A0A6T6XDG8_9EUKA|mmetsp:Transcript_33425/g.53741  ORF Transcript_33425/g.53741 Transcript_33425/m.53741 type:complete len:462 (+) Transcript_33425:196-1581(+)